MRFFGYLVALKSVFAWRALNCTSTNSGTITVDYPTAGEYSDFTISGCETLDFQKNESVTDSTVYDFTDASGDCAGFALSFWHKVDGLYIENFEDAVDCSNFSADGTYLLTYNIEVESIATAGSLKPMAPFEIVEYTEGFYTEGPGNRSAGDPIFLKVKRIYDGEDDGALPPGFEIPFPATSCSVSDPESGLSLELFNTTLEEPVLASDFIDVQVNKTDGGNSLAFQFKLFILDIESKNVLISCEVTTGVAKSEEELLSEEDEDDILVGSSGFSGLDLAATRLDVCGTAGGNDFGAPRLDGGWVIVDVTPAVQESGCFNFRVLASRNSVYVRLHSTLGGGTLISLMDGLGLTYMEYDPIHGIQHETYVQNELDMHFACKDDLKELGACQYRYDVAWNNTDGITVTEPFYYHDARFPKFNKSKWPELMPGVTKIEVVTKRGYEPIDELWTFSDCEC